MGNQQLPNTNKDSSNTNNQNPGINFDKKELKVLYKNFVKLDRDNSGQIEPSELLDVPGLKENPIVQRLITVFDKNNDGKISFYEFINGLSILTQAGTTEEKMKTAFQIYDTNNDGFVSNGDLFNITRMLVGDNLTDIQVQQLVDRTIIDADKDMDGKLSYEEFADYCKDMKITEMFSMKMF